MFSFIIIIIIIIIIIVNSSSSNNISSSRVFSIKSSGSNSSSNCCLDCGTYITGVTTTILQLYKKIRYIITGLKLQCLQRTSWNEFNRLSLALTDSIYIYMDESR